MVFSSAEAQLFPKENSKLNYRLVGFSFPEVKGVKDYAVEIAAGNYNSEEAFKTNIFSSLKTASNTIVGEVPAFGREYTWRTVYNEQGKPVRSGLHHFSVIISSEVDTNVTRLKILKPAEAYKDAYVFMDGSCTLYDMKGNPVWYVPVTTKLNPKKSRLWDMKITPQGTITFLLDQNIYEINYNGDVLWKGPNNGKVSGDSIEYYHHEFTRLTNGHYVALGTEFVSWQYPTDGGAPKKEISQGTKKSRDEKMSFGTLIEYDHEGKVLWSWKSSDYFKKMDQKYLVSDFSTPKTEKQMIDVHANAFYFDEKEKVVYLSFKNISSVIKIKYPEGTVLDVYGKLASHREKGKDLFCGQHSCKTGKDGYLFLFNNNACHGNRLPQIMKFEQPKTAEDTLKKTWVYDCDFADVMTAKQKEAQIANDTNAIPNPEILSSLNIYSKGGNIVELPDHLIFASICGIYGKVFIVSPEKETLWSAILENWNQYNRKWEDVINYKANIIINRKEIERLIWNTEKQ
jgi:hypothetical protein